MVRSSLAAAEHVQPLDGSMGVCAVAMLGERWTFLDGDVADLHSLGGAAVGWQDDRAAGVAVGERWTEEAALSSEKHRVGHRRKIAQGLVAVLSFAEVDL